MARQLYLISDVSRMLGVPPHRVAYLFTTRKLSEPPLRLGNRRVFDRSDVRRVARALGRPLDGKEGR
jgi:DNA-binding transcriptional MerR regulator